MSDEAPRLSALTFHEAGSSATPDPPAPARLTSSTGTGGSAAALRSARASHSTAEGAALARGTGSNVQKAATAALHDNPLYGLLRTHSPEVGQPASASPALRRSFEMWGSVSAEAENESNITFRSLLQEHPSEPRPSQLPTPPIRGRMPASNIEPDAALKVAAGHEAAVGNEGLAAGARRAEAGLGGMGSQDEINKMKRELAALEVKLLLAEGGLAAHEIRRKSGVGAGEEEEEAAAKELDSRSLLVKAATEKLRSSIGGPEASEVEGEENAEGRAELAQGDASTSHAAQGTEDSKGGSGDTDISKLEEKLERLTAEVVAARQYVETVLEAAQAATRAAAAEMAAIRAEAAAEVEKLKKEAVAREKTAAAQKKEAAAQKKEAAAQVAAAKRATEEVKRAAVAEMEIFDDKQRKAREEWEARERELGGERDDAKASEIAIGVRLTRALATVSSLEQRLLMVEAERDEALREAGTMRGRRRFP
ncbi:hypothetical protein KFL_001750280 [Klebsormidium nitens]|uniref:Uncharacterized protein n=1 Tax=Klebsormidium nitens TaxID=105231 RepID=A0A1Y1HZI6_KLENI|nr:hypothetical protein KFL_001750280 [Klebsormidium nitens]|eukprot:GAQ84090.1 hypothetical protein KFL_001750280 [Klebsormidium nitens]